MCVTQRSRSYVGVALLLVNRIVTRKTQNFLILPTFDLKCGLIYFDSDCSESISQPIDQSISESI